MSSELWNGNWHNLYIHLPFCASKCGYCAFYSEVGCNTQIRKAYLQKIGDFLQRSVFPEAVQSVYLGGGTPNFLNYSELACLLETIRKNVPLSENCEISCELNPECLTESKMSVLNEHVNRLSLGVQSFDALVRKKLMRSCSEEHLRKALNILSCRRAKHFNIDLIYGINGVSWQCFCNDAAMALDAGADHLSCYSLTPEENSLLGLQAPVAEDEEAADWWFAIGHLLEKYNIKRYEVSNYACPGAECIHNMNVWRGDTLLGVGAAASGFNGCDRYTFAPSIEDFIAGMAPEIDHLPEKMRMLEIFAVNLRTCNGWSKTQWEALYPGSWKRLYELSLLAAEKNRPWYCISAEKIALSEAGLLFWDEVAAEIFDWDGVI